MGKLYIRLSLRLEYLFPNFKLDKIIRAKQFEILWRAEKKINTSSSKIKKAVVFRDKPNRKSLSNVQKYCLSHNAREVEP